MSSSNLEQYLENAVRVARELAPVWASSPIPKKEALQKLVFPEGISYNLKKRAFLTQRTNSIFSVFSSLSGISREDKKGQDSVDAILSSQVVFPVQLSNRFAGSYGQIYSRSEKALLADIIINN